MAGSFGDYAENAILDYSVTQAYYVALSTADPTDDASGMAEPSGNGYARVDSSSCWGTGASSGSLANDAAITFPTASGSWGTISHWAIYDAATDGNMWWHGSLASSEAISTDQIPNFAIGALVLTLA